MVHKILKIITIFLFLLFPFYSVLSAEPLSVVINEIAWMGTNVSYNDEWIELYNTENDIPLDGWILKADDGTPGINLAGVIPGQGFYLSERTDDETVPGISADLIYKGALGNEGEDLKLFDNLGNLVDEVNFGNGWPAGDNKTKQTMERTISGDWQMSQNPGGTPKAKNNEQEAEKLPESGSGAAEKVAENSSLPTVYPAGIIFSEILPSPEGPDDTEEWIEFFNQNNFEIDLSGWKIKDKEGKTTTFIFPAGTKISPLGFLVLLRPETKITLNNGSDGLEIINPNGEISDSITFEKAPLGQCYNKTPSGWFWSTTLTPGKENVVPPPQTGQKPAFAKATAGKEETAAIKEKIPPPKLSKASPHLYVLLIAFAIAVFSAIIILILKKIIKFCQR